MERIPEPELMSDAEQAQAYAEADFEEPHSRVVRELLRAFGHPEITGTILDLGCGPGDITCRIAGRFPKAQVVAVDGSEAMVALARERQRLQARENIDFVVGFIPGVPLPPTPYDLILSTSFLHHLPDPSILWQTVSRYASPGTRIFVYDLFRPGSKEEAERLVKRYSGHEPEVLKRDFLNSLLAAFTPQEMEEQLAVALLDLSVEVIRDRHLIVFGRV